MTILSQVVWEYLFYFCAIYSLELWSIWRRKWQDLVSPLQHLYVYIVHVLALYSMCFILLYMIIAIVDFFKYF